MGACRVSLLKLTQRQSNGITNKYFSLGNLWFCLKVTLNLCIGEKQEKIMQKPNRTPPTNPTFPDPSILPRYPRKIISGHVSHRDNQ